MSRNFGALCLLLACFFAMDVATGVESNRLEVRRDEDAFSLYAEVAVNVSPEDAYSLLTDYERLDQLSGIVKHVELLASPADYRHRIHSTIEFCVLLFCGRLVQVQNVYESPNREVLLVSIPEQSNVEEGVTHWLLQPAENGTEITVFTRVEPDFWIPPVIGPWALKRVLSRQIREIAENVERLTDRHRSRCRKDAS